MDKELMKFIVGQRYISEMEPELGLGVIVELAHKRVTIKFSSVERIYSTDGAPIRRTVFYVGDEITLKSGAAQIVDTIREEDGILYYSFNTISVDKGSKGSSEISELELSDKICFTSPLERLYAGISDENSAFTLRKNVLSWLSKISGSTARGFTGGKIELLPHQFSVADSICNATRRRFFLADEVGLGKTIEAALAIHRLLLTERIKRVLIVVPAALLHQWFVELYRRFSILSTIVNDDFRVRVFESEENIFEFESPLIISDEDLASGEFSKKIMAADWDMMVVDEAHHLAEQSDSYEVVTKLSKQIPDLLLLTASPEAMEEKNFFSLLQLVDPVKYSTMDKFTEEQSRYLEVATLADSVLSLNPTKDDITALNRLLPEAIDSTKSLSLNNLSKKEAEALVLKLTDVCGVGRALFRNSRSVISGFPKRVVKNVAVKKSGNGSSKSEIKDLSNWIDTFLTENENEKCLIICKERTTQTEVHKTLSKQKTRKLTLFNEDMSIVQLDRSAAWFSEKEGATVLISTEIGSEGRNFQYADHLILLELPEEPELLEQRIGRLDRIGRSKPVSIIVPVLEGSIQERVAQWYDLGLNGFTQTVSGAHRLGLEFMGDVLAFKGNKTEWSELIKLTKNRAAEIAERVEKGRNRLLELASCNKKRSSSIVKEVDLLESSSLKTVMEKIFEHFGIFMDDLAPDLYHLDFDTLTDHTFPIPMMREEDGMSVTFNRNLALAREDVDLLTIDHPVVMGAFDLIAGSEKGNVSVSMANAAENGFLLELLFVISAPGGSKLFPERYLPTSTIRVLLNQDGENVGKQYDEQFFAESTEPSSLELLKKANGSIEKDIKKIIDSTTKRVKAHCDKLLKKGLVDIKKQFADEITRVKHLSNDKFEIELLKSERELLLENIGGGSYRIEGVRVIGLER